MKAPSFSIVVPTYQRREIVCDCLRALCNLTYDGPVEIIVVVDGSTDGTEEALETIKCPFPTKIIVQPNAGLAAARNRGAKEAAGEVLLFLDDDMMASPDLLEQHAGSHSDGAEVVLGHIPIDPASPDTFLVSAVSGWAEQRSERLQRREPALFDLVSGHLSIRRDLFEAVGGYDESFTEGGSFGDEDLDFAVRLGSSHTFHFNPHAITFQRYVVSPRHNLRQWTEAGQSDVRFARKHPGHAAELFELHGRSRWATRLLLRPLAAIPLVPGAISAAACRLADMESRLPRSFRRPVGKLFAVARDLAYWRAVRRAGGIPSGTRVLVLCYHAVSDLSGDPVLSQYGIPPKQFARQLDSLFRRGFNFIGPDEFERLLAGEGRVPSRAVLVTFDDCYEELKQVAREILQPRSIPGLAFAVTGMKSGTNEWDQRIGARTLRLLDAGGLRELDDRGVEIGCHSKSHRPMTSLPDSALAAETEGAADELAALGLRRPRFFAYPHGSQDERIRAAVRKAGFTAAFGLTPKFVSRQANPFDIPRVEVFARDTSWRFRLKTAYPPLTALFRADPLHMRIRWRIAGAVRRLGAASGA